MSKIRSQTFKMADIEKKLNELYLKLSKPQETTDATLVAMSKSITEMKANSTSTTLRPDIFHGKISENVREWCAKFRAYITLHNWDQQPAKVINSMQLMLEDGALSWFLALHDKHKMTLDELCNAFIGHFQSQKPTWLLEQQLWSRTMSPTENLEEYILDIHRLCQELSKSDKEQTASFVRGLPPTIRCQVVQKDPQNWTEACQAARLAQQAAAFIHPAARDGSDTDMRNMMSLQAQSIAELASAIKGLQTTSSAPSEDAHVSHIGRPPKTICQLCDTAGHSAPDCQQQQQQMPRQTARQIICYYCNKKGHIIRDCRKRQHDAYQHAHLNGHNPAM